MRELEACRVGCEVDGRAFESCKRRWRKWPVPGVRQPKAKIRRYSRLLKLTPQVKPQNASK